MKRQGGSVSQARTSVSPAEGGKGLFFFCAFGGVMSVPGVVLKIEWLESRIWATLCNTSDGSPANFDDWPQMRYAADIIASARYGDKALVEATATARRYMELGGKSIQLLNGAA